MVTPICDAGGASRVESCELYPLGAASGVGGVLAVRNWVATLMAKVPRPGAAMGLITLRYSGPEGSHGQWVAVAETYPVQVTGGNVVSAPEHDGAVVGAVELR